ncbi:MAG: hypothetical protein LN410_00695 [Candidatus Thermoplasmatota archaeon]|nr:hypothetical protein [Candidatus Thermoplasmatota archaeon]
MRARSGHILLDSKVRFQDLEPLFRDLFALFLEESEQTRDDPEFFEIILEENLRDLRNDRKPEGFNRDGMMRLIFPLSERKEFYLYASSRSVEVPRVTQALSQLLQQNKIPHEIEWDGLLRDAGKP